MKITKRSFFKSISAIVAAVALAPEIAFGRKLDFTTDLFPPPEPDGFILMQWKIEDGVETGTVIPEEDWEKVFAGSNVKVVRHYAIGGNQPRVRQ